MFGELILGPELNREPQYDSGYPDKAQYYDFDGLCGYTMKLNLPSCIENYRNCEDVPGSENAEAIRDHFNLRKDHRLINGWFKIVPQGITQLLPSYNACSRTKCPLRAHFAVDVGS